MVVTEIPTLGDKVWGLEVGNNWEEWIDIVSLLLVLIGVCLVPKDGVLVPDGMRGFLCGMLELLWDYEKISIFIERPRNVIMCRSREILDHCPNTPWIIE